VEVTQLTAAYRFLRLVENRIQAYQDKQTHLLPKDEPGRLRLARAMGFADWDGFSRVLGEHRGRVQGLFDQVFAAPAAEGHGPPAGDTAPGDRREKGPAIRVDPALATLWNGGPAPPRAEEVLTGFGFADPGPKSSMN
jgi:glutamate-ammonia-ligase adenylyltransferase